MPEEGTTAVDRVVVGIDFSEASRHALARAAVWTAALGVPLMALHVLSVPVALGGGFEAHVPGPGWFHVEEEQARNRLQEWIAGIPGATSEVTWGPAAETLLQHAGERALLVVGHKRHARMEHLLLGNVAAHLVRRGRCEVLVVPEA